MEAKTHHNHIAIKVDNTDLDGYYNKSISESDTDNNWLLSAALLLGVSVATLEASGGLTEEVYSNIMSMTISVDAIPGISEADLNYYKLLQEDIKQYGRMQDPKTIENLGYKWTETQTDQIGLFGDIEAYKSGALDAYRAAEACGASIMLPWNPTGENTCDNCMAEVENGPFKPEDFPSPVHYNDQCNDPMAEPVIVFGAGLGTNIIGEVI
jgi:hypothetical protein